MFTADSKEYGSLPMFPMLYTQNEERIERAVERLMDCADAQLMGNRVTQAQYDVWVKALNRWADDCYGRIRDR
jgi:hypothetical protein